MNETIENRKLVKMYLNERVMFQLQKAPELGSFSLMVMALESMTLEMDYELSLHN